MLLFVLRIYSLGDMFLLYSKHVTPIKRKTPQTFRLLQCVQTHETVPEGLPRVINLFLQLWICLWGHLTKRKWKNTPLPFLALCMFTCTFPWPCPSEIMLQKSRQILEMSRLLWNGLMVNLLCLRVILNCVWPACLLLNGTAKLVYNSSI